MVSRRILTSKKGNAIVELVIVLAVVFVFALIGMFAFQSFDSFYQERTDMFDSNESLQAMETTHQKMPGVIDGGAVFILVGLWIATLVLAFSIESHPVFFVISLLLLIFSLIGVIALQNFYEEYFASDSDLTTLQSNFPAINFVFSHLLVISIVMGLSILVVLYGKSVS